MLKNYLIAIHEAVKTIVVLPAITSSSADRASIPIITIDARAT
jgi:hypothetical protein